MREAGRGWERVRVRGRGRGMRAVLSWIEEEAGVEEGGSEVWGWGRRIGGTSIIHPIHLTLPFHPSPHPLNLESNLLLRQFGTNFL